MRQAKISGGIAIDLRVPDAYYILFNKSQSCTLASNRFKIVPFDQPTSWTCGWVDNFEQILA